MLFKDCFKAKAYQKIYAIGYYTPTNGTVTVQYKIGKQPVSSIKLPQDLFDKLEVTKEEDDVIIILPDWLKVNKDSDSGFRTLRCLNDESSED